MALSGEQEALLRQTARGTPMGEFLRRYWHPVATAVDLTADRPAKRVRILSQTHVLFKDTAGRAALIPERCPHEGASMLMGAINDHGITCLLHGWFFDTERMCSVWDDDTVWADGYPVREHAGLYWAYLGPEPAPPLPTDGVLGQAAGRRRIIVYPPMRGNWLLKSRSGLDPWRSYQRLITKRGDRTRPAARTIDFTRSTDGISKRLEYVDGSDDIQPFVLPTHLHAGPLWLLTPIDQEQTMVISVELVPNEGGAEDGEGVEVVVIPPGERNSESGSDALYNFFAPWGADLPEGVPGLGWPTDERIGESGTELVHVLLLEQVEAAASDAAESKLSGPNPTPG